MPSAATAERAESMKGPGQTPRRNVTATMTARAAWRAGLGETTRSSVGSLMYMNAATRK